MWHPTWGKQKAKDQALKELKEQCCNLQDPPSDPWPTLTTLWTCFVAARTYDRVNLTTVTKHETLPGGGSLHKVGVWFRLSLKQPLPPLQNNSGVHTSSWQTYNGREYIKTLHSSKSYSFNSVMQRGLRPGRATKSSLEGVYMYPTDDGTYARSSSGYRVYSTFFKDGLFWSVVYECRFGQLFITTLGK